MTGEAIGQFHGELYLLTLHLIFTLVTAKVLLRKIFLSIPREQVQNSQTKQRIQEKTYNFREKYDSFILFIVLSTV